MSAMNRRVIAALMALASVVHSVHGQSPMPYGGDVAMRPGIGLTSDDQVPEIPGEVLSQLPPGCTTTWSGRPSSAQLMMPQVAPQAAGGAAPAAVDPYTAASNSAGRAVHMIHGSYRYDAASVPDNSIRAQLAAAHRMAQLEKDDPLALADDPLSLGGDDDPLGGLGPRNRRSRGGGGDKGADAPKAKKTPDPHEALWAEDCYPSAATCAKCHPKHYEDWRASSHAYAGISPMFQVFEQLISELSQGTVGYFCVRCHMPVATQMKSIERSTTILDAPVVIREGITCIACHRVNEMYNKVNGARRVEPGDIHAPVYGNVGGAGVNQAIAEKDKHKLKLSPDDKGPGQAMHLEGRFFEPLSRSEFCMPCHQVAVHPGIALEVVWNQYRNSPAWKNGVSCQDCHMGHTPGKAYGYSCEPIAELAGKPFGPPRKFSNHNFWGPNYSIAHPGVFPHNPKADRWSPREWLSFDWRAGWGTEDFERSIRGVQGMHFPPPWDDADDRRDARKIIDSNLKRAVEKRDSGIATLSAAVRLDGPHLKSQPRVNKPLNFKIHVHNGSDGHNLPTASLGAQPQQWLNVTLIDPFGRIVWETGYLDSNGDLAELMSEDVANGKIRPDYQLFNLQTKFLITNVKGPDREFPLPVNVDVDQIPFLRPGNVPFSVLNHPPFIRMEAHSIPPDGVKTASYRIPADAFRQPGTYRISARFRARLEPPYFMRLCKSTPEMIRRMNEQIMDIAPQTTEIFVR